MIRRPPSSTLFPSTTLFRSLPFYHDPRRHRTGEREGRRDEHRYAETGDEGFLDGLLHRRSRLPTQALRYLRCSQVALLSLELLLRFGRQVQGRHAGIQAGGEDDEDEDAKSRYREK